MTGPRDVDVASLLRIDVVSELRKLCASLLQGPHHLACELVRRAMRDGASNVTVGLGRRHLRVVHDGHNMDEPRLHAIEAMLSSRVADDDRHAALVAVEARGDLPLVAPITLGARQVELRSGGLRLVLEEDRPPTLEVVGNADGRTTIAVEGLATDPRRSLEWLRALCRFAPARIQVGTEVIGQTRPRGLVSRPLRAPLQGGIAIPHTGDTAQVWLTEYGVVSTHVVIPRAPALEAVVELGEDGPTADPVRVRDAFEPLEESLIHQAIDTLRAAVPELPDGPARQRAARVLLQALKHGRFIRELATVPVFAVVEPDGSRTSADLVRLRAVTARSSRRLLWALYPDADPDEHVLPDEMVLVADDDQRSLLTGLLGVRFSAPRPRPGGSFLGSMRRILRGWRRGLADGVALLLHPGAGRPLPGAEMTRSERALMDALDAGGDGDVAVLTAGRGPIRHRRGQPTALPRGNPTVTAAVKAHARDPRWLYPAAYALLGTAADPSLASRARWRAGSTGGSAS